MDTLFLFIVILMFLLAITDLIVGVSNDAVNFLNSAIGAKAGSFRKIMIIASIGIMFGAVFSSGMMEVARKGIFNPQFFTIEEIMFLFAAVMLTDIILLDFYNTIALPTSTTVSIVFELLGSAIAISFFSVMGKGHSIAEWGNYINGSRALIIIMGIFLSVVLAFILGWLVQYIARLIVTFEISKSRRSFGSVFGAGAVALILVFIILKGLQGIPYFSTDFLSGLKSNAGMISLVAFVISFLVFQFLSGRTGFNVYQFITLLGTFALAMAFASNDLVNFVGVPIASFDSYIHWKESPTESTQYMMGALSEPVQTKPIFLIISGIIMTITLWLSRKARSVVQTSVNLGRQQEGFERFEGNEIARGIVKSISSFSSFFRSMLPDSFNEKIKNRFILPDEDKNRKSSDKAAFDMVRASVNLIVAAGIILVATSFKLPLSTTFVSFMVLMGTSLADKAWAKGSAVYRVSGVLVVVGGWFLTAIIALTVSIVFASLLMAFKVYALALIVLFAFFLIYRNIRSYNKRRKMESFIQLTANNLEFEEDKLHTTVREKVSEILVLTRDSYNDVILGLLNKDRRKLISIKEGFKDALGANNLNKIDITRQMPEVPKKYQINAKIFMFIYDLEDSMLHPMGEIIKASDKHVKNLHQDLIEEEVEDLTRVNELVQEYINEILAELGRDAYSESKYAALKQKKKALIHLIEDNISNLIRLSNEKKLSSKNSQLFLTIMFSTKNLVVRLGRYNKLIHLLSSSDFSERMLDQIIEG